MIDICLVAAPYSSIRIPSMALGILKSSLTNAGLTSKVIYSNVRFADKIGFDSYIFFESYSYEDLLGEWTFSSKAFHEKFPPGFKVDGTEYLTLVEKIVRLTFDDKELKIILKGKKFDEFFYEIRREASEFIDSEAAHILEFNPRIVGCSSTFQNHCFSLALLRKIRELAPDVITMMGGANCEDTLGMVTHEKFNWVDYVVSGEAELLLPGLCRKIFENGRDIELESMPPGVIGPAHRSNHSNVTKPAHIIIDDMDQSPIPDFDDYFKAIENTPSIKNHLYPIIVFETSRGCWWGEKNQCAFCGFNGNSLAYRSKSAERVIVDLETLSGKYGINNFLAIDNVLNMEYFKTLFPRLSKSKKKYYIGFETKANLSREQVKIMADGGVTCIQPGMESLHNEALKRLNKGTNVWINIQLLKWTLEFGIVNNWVFLHGLPDDSDDWYKNAAEIVPLIIHLQAPNLYHKIYYTRFSQYHKNPGKYNLKLKPYATYRYVYPFPDDDLDKFAYLFDIEKKSGAGENTQNGKGKQALEKELFKWAERWLSFKTNQAESPYLLRMEEIEGVLTILDTRPCAVEKHIKLEGLPALVYKICDTASTWGRVLSKLKESGYYYKDRQEIIPVMEDLERKKIILKLEDRYLSLAVRKSNYKFPWEYLRPVEKNIYSPGDENLKDLFGK